MASEKLVRCVVSRNHGFVEPKPPSARYVPLDVFQLWEYLMRHRHNFSISDKMTSLWFERGGTTESRYTGLDVEPVTRVELFFFSPDDGMLHQKVRYFPSDDPERYAGIRDTFLSHYRESIESRGKEINYREHAGVWITR